MLAPATHAGNLPGMGERDRWLTAEDSALLAQCKVDTYRASGPGGQKRNKTSSAVRLRHGPTGLIVIAEESRSQHENKAKALRRLRLAIAVGQRAALGDDWRVPEWLGPYVSGGRLAMATSNPHYPRLVALLLDVLEASKGRMADAASLLGITTSQLARALAGERALQAAANEIRKRWGTAERGGGPRLGAG